MPYKFETEKLLIPKELDRRIKLPKEKHEEIRKLSDQGISQRKLALLYGVSRRLIVFILFPERLEKSKQRLKENQRKYYNKDKIKVYIKSTRDYKKSIKDKLIKEK